MRLEELAEPAGEVGLFEHEAFVGGGNGLDVLDQLLGLGGETPPLDFVTLIIELTEDTIFGVGDVTSFFRAG
jgi:hypothetical protein